MPVYLSVWVSNAVPTPIAPPARKELRASVKRGRPETHFLVVNATPKFVPPPTPVKNPWFALVDDVKKSVETVFAGLVRSVTAIVISASVQSSLLEIQNINALLVSDEFLFSFF